MTQPCFVAPIVTDIHFFSSDVRVTYYKMIDNLRCFVKNIPCDAIINLGDITDGDTSHATTLARADMVTTDFLSLGVPYFTTIGNHDTNYQSSSGRLNFAETYRAYMAAVRDNGIVYDWDAYGTNYYKDFSTGIRLVVLNANYETEYKYSPNAAAWLKNVALTPDKIILFATHESPNKLQNGRNINPVNGSAIVQVLEEFVNAGGKVIQINGHCHADYAFDPNDTTVSPVAKWLAVVNTCAKFEHNENELPDGSESFKVIQGIESRYGCVSPERNGDDYTEDAWTVMVIRPLSKKVNFIRFGAGFDREFNI